MPLFFSFLFFLFPLYTNLQYNHSRVCLGFGCLRIQGLEDYIFNLKELRNTNTNSAMEHSFLTPRCHIRQSSVHNWYPGLVFSLITSESFIGLYLAIFLLLALLFYFWDSFTLYPMLVWNSLSSPGNTYTLSHPPPSASHMLRFQEDTATFRYFSLLVQATVVVLGLQSLLINTSGRLSWLCNYRCHCWALQFRTVFLGHVWAVVMDQVLCPICPTMTTSPDQHFCSLLVFEWYLGNL